MCWWAFTGLTHILIEGPFVFTPDFFSKNNPNFFDEVCKLQLASISLPTSYYPSYQSRWSFEVSCVVTGKEYSKGDSRYVARDTATVTIEGITAVLEGPASLLAVYVFSHIVILETSISSYNSWKSSEFGVTGY
jgi:cholestenol delta-isomerase